MTNIALTPDDTRAVYGTTEPVDGPALIQVDISAGTFTRHALGALPVTDVDITADSGRAVVGTQSGISVLTIATGAIADAAAPGGTPLRTGLSLYADDSWATVGIEPGVRRVDPVTLATKTVTTTTPPLTNVSVAPDGSIGVAGLEKLFGNS